MVNKRNNIIKQYLEEASGMTQHISSLRAEMSAINDQSKHKAHLIRENALMDAHKLLSEYTSQLNKMFSEKTMRYDVRMKEQYETLLSQTHTIVDEVKEKVKHYIIAPYRQ